MADTSDGVVQGASRFCTFDAAAEFPSIWCYIGPIIISILRVVDESVS